MKYRRIKGYKYVLSKAEVVVLKYKFPLQITTKYINLVKGVIEGQIGYAWDGASGPTIDDVTNMLAALVHDMLYQLMREGWLDRKYRKAADKELRRIMIKEGLRCLREWDLKHWKGKKKKNTRWNRTLVRVRANYYYHAVRWFGEANSHPEKNPRGQEFEI